MRPVLFRIGSFEIYSYGVLLAIAYCVSLYFIRKEAVKKGIDSKNIWDISFWCLILGGMAGGKLAHIIFNISRYFREPFNATLWLSGFMFYGGLILSTTTIFFYTKKQKLSFLSIVDLIIPYLALGQTIGRIGCFLAGCCYGKPTELPWGMIFRLDSPAGYHYRTLKLHPTQLYSSLFLFILFWILKKSEENKKFEGETFLLYLILYPAFRFFLDFLRGDSLFPIFYHLNLFQIACIMIVVVSLVILAWKIKRQNRNREEAKN